MISYYIRPPLFRTEGYRGLFRGSLLTLARDVPAFCSYFATYETLRTMVRREDGRVGVLDTALIGGVSGVIGWAVEIPFDNIKNRHQVISSDLVTNVNVTLCHFRSVLENAQYHKLSTELLPREDCGSFTGFNRSV